MGEVASAWHEHGRRREAIATAEECLQLRREAEGLKHPDTKRLEELLARWKSEGEE
jgi:hypothetical protein